MKDVLIFGTSDFAQVAHYYLTNDSPYRVAGFTVDGKYIKEKEFLGLPVIPFEDIETKYPPDKFGMFIAIAYKDVNRARANKYFEAKEKGYEMISYVCSKSVLWGEPDIGDNCFIFENQTIQPFVKIGDNVIIWSGNHIGHHTKIGDHCFIASHVVISGGVTVEPYCFLGVNATIRDGITIARDCIIGMGASIVKDTKEKGVYTGQPAKLFAEDSSKVNL